MNFTIVFFVLSERFRSKPYHLFSYQIMLACWASDCEDRPSFQTLNEQLFDMQKEEHPYVNVDPSQDFILPPTAGQGEINKRKTFVLEENDCKIQMLQSCI